MTQELLSAISEFLRPAHVDWRYSRWTGKMCRKINCRWEYRKETEDEWWERFHSTQW